jgi:hypothetical protein
MADPVASGIIERLDRPSGNSKAPLQRPQPRRGYRPARAAQDAIGKTGGGGDAIGYERSRRRPKPNCQQGCIPRSPGCTRPEGGERRWRHRAWRYG